MWLIVYIIFVIADIITFIVPKRISKIEIYTSTIFALLYGISVDEVLDLHLNLYGYFKKGFQWDGFIGSFMYFIPVSVLFLNYFPIEKQLKRQILYIFVWVIISIGFEWFTVQTKYLYYREWKLWYSAVMYPFIYLILLGNWKLVRKLIELNRITGK
jgi:hypothetical protein